MVQRIFLSILFLTLGALPAVAGPKNILLDNFETAAMTNRLGGYVGTDTERPGTCQFSFTWRAQDTFGSATHSMQVDYEVPEPDNYTFLWFHLGPEGPDGKVQTVDLSDHGYLSFWAKAGKPGEDFKVELHCDSDRNGRYEHGKDEAGGVYLSGYLDEGRLTDKWQKVVIPLNDFRSVKDRSRAMEIVIVFEHDRGLGKGTVFLDEIILGAKPVPASREKLRLPLPTVLMPATVHSQENPALRVGEVHQLVAQPVPSYVLEGIGFEVSWDEGRSWQLVGIDYETSRGISWVDWHVPVLPLAGRVLVRAFSQGIYSYRSKGQDVLALDLLVYSEAEWIDEMARRSFLYFRDNQDPVTGLFMDSVGSDASSAVTGFGLAAMAIGADRGWIDETEARDSVLRTLRTFALLQRGESISELAKKEREALSEHAGVSRKGRVALENSMDYQRSLGLGDALVQTLASIPQGVGNLLFGGVPPSRDGMFYHFMDATDGTRSGDSEISVVDTALFLFGALAAGEYFGGDVQAMARRLYDEAQWAKFYDPQAGVFRMAWSPEQGYFPNHWDYYTDEAMLLHILAAGSTTSPVPGESFYKFKREEGNWHDGANFVYSWSGSLFTHQYAPAWLDLSGLVDAEGRDWWENSRRAILANRDFCWYSEERPVAYGPHRWGISSVNRPEGYVMHFGALPNGQDSAQEDGTLSPIAVASSITFVPFEAMNDIKYQVQSYPFLWGPYGLRNAFNLERNWFSNIDFGLDTGLLLLSLVNFQDQFVWKLLAQSDVIRRGLKASGFDAAAPSAAVARKTDFPPPPPGASEPLLRAHKLLRQLEHRWLQGSPEVYREFLHRAPRLYQGAMQSLSEEKAVHGAVAVHREWLSALAGTRRASFDQSRRHFWRMLQLVHENGWEAREQLAVVGPYLLYAMQADLRDFQPGLYDLFQAHATLLGEAKYLEDLAEHLLAIGCYAMAAKAFRDAFAVGGRVPRAYAQGVADRFAEAGRVREAEALQKL